MGVAGLGKGRKAVFQKHVLLLLWLKYLHLTSFSFKGKYAANWDTLLWEFSEEWVQTKSLLA